MLPVVLVVLVLLVLLLTPSPASQPYLWQTPRWIRPSDLSPLSDENNDAIGDFLVRF